MKKSSLLPTLALPIALGILVIWSAPVRTKILLVVLVVPASLIGSALTGYVVQLISRKHGRTRHHRMLPKQGGGLRITASGRIYIDSPAYEMQMLAAVAQFWGPEKEFYELLLNMTAMCLCESDPAKVGAAAFKQFVADNLPTIRAAIDRIKISQPAIKLSEENWGTRSELFWRDSGRREDLVGSRSMLAIFAFRRFRSRCSCEG